MGQNNERDVRAGMPAGNAATGHLRCPLRTQQGKALSGPTGGAAGIPWARRFSRTNRLLETTNVETGSKTGEIYIHHFAGTVKKCAGEGVRPACAAGMGWDGCSGQTRFTKRARGAVPARVHLRVAGGRGLVRDHAGRDRGGSATRWRSVSGLTGFTRW